MKKKKINNVNISSLIKTVESIKKDKRKAKKKKFVVGEWNLKGNKPQFTAKVSFGNKSIVLKADAPKPFGGSEKAPEPLQYCLFGLASCFSHTFVTLASMKGIELEKYEIYVENNVNILKVFGIDEKTPIIENVKIVVKVKAKNASKKQLKELLDEAAQKCPAMFCLKNPIKVSVKLE